ncbi:MAG: chromophore lyase CpcT/CpeT [Phycisphaerales bacterium]
MRLHRTIIAAAILATAFALPACSTSKPESGRATRANTGLDDLATTMTGWFSSLAQSESDSSIYHIRLVMVPIWEDRDDDARWLYVEQAVAETPGEPYRQRVYRLTALDDGIFESAVYTLPGDPQDFTGAWRTPGVLEQLSMADLTLREGCSIRLRALPEGRYTGSTVGDDCVSQLRGAAYATSEVTIFPDRLISWDRGFDASGQQVWGAENGGYIFDKVSEQPPT